jgi:hypothetical protein
VERPTSLLFLKERGVFPKALASRSRETFMPKDQNTFAKRRREMEKKRKAEAKRERRRRKRAQDNAPADVPDTNGADATSPEP